MTRSITGAIAGLLIGTFASVVMDTSPAYADNHAVIKQRIELMRKGVLGNFKVIKAFAKDGKGSMADVAAAAEGIKASAEKLLPLFPKGTGRPDYVIKKPVLWPRFGKTGQLSRGQTMRWPRMRSRSLSTLPQKMPMVLRQALA